MIILLNIRATFTTSKINDKCYFAEKLLVNQYGLLFRTINRITNTQQTEQHIHTAQEKTKRNKTMSIVAHRN